MIDRPNIDNKINGDTFRSFYYLKEELVDFCRSNGIPTSGGKIELTDRIAYYLDTGKILPTNIVKRVKSITTEIINEESEIEANFVCSEKHRAFLRTKLANLFLLMWLFRNG